MRNDDLIVKYLPLARKLGRQYGTLDIDGVAEAQFAMVIAAQKFDTRKGGSFPLYVTYAIRDRLKRLRAKSLPVSVDWQEIGQVAALVIPAEQEPRAIRHEFVQFILKSLTKPEKRLLLLLLRQERQGQIAERYGVSQSTISRRVTALGIKAKALVEAYNGG